MVGSCRRLVTLLTIAVLLSALLPALSPATLPALAQSAESLAPPPIAGPGDIPAPSVFDAAAVAVDPSIRAEVVAFYGSQYLVSESYPTTIGNASTCTPGATTTAFKTAVLQRINYFRAMAGVPPITEIDAAASADAQEAALMMSAQGDLSHDPGSDWACYTATGDTTAGQANLSLGSMGWDAINTYMRDPGLGNYFVGHRRWLLYPAFREFGSGDVAPTGKSRANALKIFNLPTGASTMRDGYVAWPPPGYVPYQTVYPRWSFSLGSPTADFSNATVTVTEAGREVPVVIVNTGMNGYGLNTLVWTMDGVGSNQNWPNPGSDKTYDIQIGNVAGGPYSYSVTVIDPSTAAPTATATASPSATLTVTATASATLTATSSPSPTPSRTATASQTPSATPTPATSPTSTADPNLTTTADPGAGSTTATASPAGPTATPTSTSTGGGPASTTPDPGQTGTPGASSSPTATTPATGGSATATTVPGASATATPTSSITPGPQTPTVDPSVTVTVPGGVSPTASTTTSSTPSPTPSPSASATQGTAATATATAVPGPPEMTFDKEKSKYNGWVEATLSGFAPGYTVTLRWPGGTVLAQVQADGNGEAIASFRTPLFPLGDYTVRASDSSGNVALAELRVIPRILLNEYAGPPGMTIRVYYYGFSPGEQVEVQWYTSSTKYTVLKTVTIADNGRGTTLIDIPTNATVGDHTIRGKVIGVSRSATDTFTVTAPGSSEAPAATATSTATETATPEATAEATLEPTMAPTLEPTSTSTPEPTATGESTATPEPTATATSEVTETATPEPSPTEHPDPAEQTATEPAPPEQSTPDS